MAIRGIIFDMDGTITAPYLRFAEIKDKAGIGDRDMLEFLQTATGDERARVERLLHEFEHDGVTNARLNPGARKLLTFLKRQRIPTGLLTRNSRRSVDAVCAKLKLLFDVTVTREDAPYKPAPDAIWRMTERWGLKPAEVLMVGDYKWDLICARNAGTPCAVLINNGGVPDWAIDAEHVVYRLSELIPIVEEAGPR